MYEMTADGSLYEQNKRRLNSSFSSLELRRDLIASSCCKNSFHKLSLEKEVCASSMSKTLIKLKAFICTSKGYLRVKNIEKTSIAEERRWSAHGVEYFDKVAQSTVLPC